MYSINYKNFELVILYASLPFSGIQVTNVIIEKPKIFVRLVRQRSTLFRTVWKINTKVTSQAIC
jgi:hypothetical protein